MRTGGEDYGRLEGEEVTQRKRKVRGNESGRRGSWEEESIYMLISAL